MYHAYIAEVIRKGDLYIEIERVRQLLILSEKNRGPTRERIQQLNVLFKALLSAKDAREKVVQNIREDNRSHPQDGCPRPTDDTGASVGVRDVLKKEVPGSGQ